MISPVTWSIQRKYLLKEACCNPDPKHLAPLESRQEIKQSLSTHPEIEDLVLVRQARHEGVFGQVILLT